MPEIRIDDAMHRIQKALEKGRTTVWTDGTLNSRIVSVDGSCSILDSWLSIETELFGWYQLPVHEGVYWLDGWTLRDAKDALYIGPSWYLHEWPCRENCRLSDNGKCRIRNCLFPLT